MDTASFRAALRYRIFATFPGHVSAGECLCKRISLIDRAGHHLATGCPKFGRRQETHDRIVHELDSILKYSGFRTVREEYGAFEVAIQMTAISPTSPSATQPVVLFLLISSMCGTLGGSKHGILQAPTTRGAAKVHGGKSADIYQVGRETNTIYFCE
jgi:hypothetical protein